MPERRRSGTATMRSARSTCGASHRLSLAAAPAFAVMALITAMSGGAAHGESPLTGMAPMYLLMAAFHSAPWLDLASGRRSEARPRE